MKRLRITKYFQENYNSPEKKTVVFDGLFRKGKKWFIGDGRADYGLLFAIHEGGTWTPCHVQSDVVEGRITRFLFERYDMYRS